jgi:hypothetical protein
MIRPRKVMSFSKPDRVRERRREKEGYFMIQIKVGQQTLVTTATDVNFTNTFVQGINVMMYLYNDSQTFLVRGPLKIS